MGKKLLLLTTFVLFLIPLTYAQQSNTCPIDIPDRPAIPYHIEHDDIQNRVISIDEVLTHGEMLFTAVFNRCDGQGRPATTGSGNQREIGQPEFTRISGPDANSCAGCHNQPAVGGAGDFVANVFVLAQAADPIVDSISPEFSNNRNTLGMFGTGGIEMLAREMTVSLHQIRDYAISEAQATDETVSMPLTTHGVNFGVITALPDGTLVTDDVEGINDDLIIRPFHQSGVVISLRQFTVNATNHHHGMQAEERFDLNPLINSADYDQDGISRELTLGDITAMTLWQASLPAPTQVLPTDPDILASVEQGEVLFAQIGCTNCHIPEIEIESCMFTEPNPYNPVGTYNDLTQPIYMDLCQTAGFEQTNTGVVIRAYTDLKRHNLCDPVDMPDAIRFFCDEQLAQERPEQGGMPAPEFFITRRLWDVGNSAPYGHGGNLTTIGEAILVHGGEARATRDAFVALTAEEQLALVDFLRTLQVVPADG